MLDYLKNYNLSDNQIGSIREYLLEGDYNINVFEYEPENTCKILDLFVSIGVTNLYYIILANPSIFCVDVSEVERRLNRFDDKQELARLLNEDPSNLALVGLL